MRMRNLSVLIVNPAIERGKPPRDIKVSDLVWAPVKRHGTYNFGDMLNDDSIRNLITVYNALTAPALKRKKALKAPHKS